jgi:hypothetical protein
MSREERESKIVRGIVIDRDIPEYTRLYDQVIARAQASLQSSSDRGPHNETTETTVLDQTAEGLA